MCNRISNIFAISDFQQKNPAPEKKRGSYLELNSSSNEMSPYQILLAVNRSLKRLTKNLGRV